MGERLVESVPNVSEGRDRAAIEAMAAALQSGPTVRLLDVQSDPDHHRTVFTLVGDPDGVADAILRLFAAALPGSTSASTGANTRGWGRWTWSRSCRCEG